MDCPRALVKAMAEFPPRWDFSNWTYLTIPHKPRMHPRRNIRDSRISVRIAKATLGDIKFTRVTDDVDVIQAETIADVRRASAKERSAPYHLARLPLFDFTSREEPAVLSKQTPSQSGRPVSARNGRFWSWYSCRRRAEKPKDIVEYEQQLQAMIDGAQVREGHRLEWIIILLIALDITIHMAWA